jgi:hypothetical protein
MPTVNVHDALERTWDVDRIVRYARANSRETRVPVLILEFRRMQAARADAAPAPAQGTALAAKAGSEPQINTDERRSSTYGRIRRLRATSVLTCALSMANADGIPC